MQSFYPIFKKCPMFSEMTEQQLADVLDVLDVKIRSYTKNQVVRRQEVEVTEIGVVLKGTVFTAKFDIYGNRFILNEISEAQTFGEALSFTKEDNSPISIVSTGCSVVAFLSAQKVYGLPAESELGKLLAQGLIRLLVQKNLQLQMKNDILSQKTIRKKLLLYLEYQSKTANSKAFRIDFSREELADFLSLNSNALSRELGKMRDEGLLTFKRNKFVLNKID